MMTGDQLRNSPFPGLPINLIEPFALILDQLNSDEVAGDTVHLNAAALAVLLGTDVVLVPAPGAGLMVELASLDWEYVPGVGRWNGNPLTLCYGGDSATDVIADGDLDISGLVAGTVGFTQSSRLVAARTALANKALTLVEASADLTFTGPVVTVAIAAGGTGYTANDVVTIGGNAGTKATATVSTVNGSGVVTALALTTAGGPIYDTANNPHTTTGGTGTGLTVNVTAIVPADGDLYVTPRYRLRTLH